MKSLTKVTHFSIQVFYEEWQEVSFPSMQIGAGLRTWSRQIQLNSSFNVTPERQGKKKEFSQEVSLSVYLPSISFRKKPK